MTDPTLEALLNELAVIEDRCEELESLGEPYSAIKMRKDLVTRAFNAGKQSMAHEVEERVNKRLKRASERPLFCYRQPLFMEGYERAMSQVKFDLELRNTTEEMK